MYLEQAVVENNGPLEWLHLNLLFSPEGLPKPLILVGGNGSGKTNLLSLIVDALFEGAAAHFEDALPAKGMGRLWFRVVGGRTIRTGCAGSFSALRFRDGGSMHFYREKSGFLDPTTAYSRSPLEFSGQYTWPAEGSFKEFHLEDEVAKRIYESGVYAYFPSSRSEVPHWQNSEVFPDTEFDIENRFSKRIKKPIRVDRALDKFTQWLIGVLADGRTELRMSRVDEATQWFFAGNPDDAQQTQSVIQVCNKLLQAVMSDDAVQFLWLGRKSAEKVSVLKDGKLLFPGLSSMSTGQAILLGLFGSIIRYADISQNGMSIDLNAIEGICIVDEIDAHIHVELQHKILPKLIELFPRIQFIVSSHSPLFVLGMEQKFGAEGIQVIDMPSGVPVGAETYSDFGHALEAVAASHAFTERVIEATTKLSRPKVFVEGETDPPYLIAAAKALGKDEILNHCDIEWIGAKDTNKQGFHTGAEALRHTLSVFKANPSLLGAKILLLHDNDSKSQIQDYEKISVRVLAVNPANAVVKAGIENYLPENAITEEFYQERTTKKPGGDILITRSLRKMELCQSFCSDTNPEKFVGFIPALAIIEDFLGISTPDEATE